MSESTSTLPRDDVRLNGRIIGGVTVDFWATIARDSTREERRKRRRDILLEWLEAKDVTPGEEALYEVLTGFAEWWSEQWQHRQITPGAVDMARHVARHYEVEAGDEELAELALKLDRTGVEVPPERIEGAKEALTALAERFPIALISDTGVSMGDTLDMVLDSWGMLDLFKGRVYSEQIGSAKPNRRMFMAAMDILEVPQQRIVHIGDLDATDVLGAKSIGMAAIRFDGVKEREECKKCSMADAVVDSWDDIVRLLSPGDRGDDPTSVKL